mmetsp:Transcript_161809/g.310779  ORF Transcript_161809/g.310779 Transcript_161809/m.310779 type:complete len:137 (-) Transcript_161809:14-424(-)
MGTSVGLLSASENGNVETKSEMPEHPDKFSVYMPATSWFSAEPAEKKEPETSWFSSAPAEKKEPEAADTGSYFSSLFTSAAPEEAEKPTEAEEGSYFSSLFGKSEPPPAEEGSYFSSLFGESEPPAKAAPEAAEGS